MAHEFIRPSKIEDSDGFEGSKTGKTQRNRQSPLLILQLQWNELFSYKSFIMNNLRGTCFLQAIDYKRLCLFTRRGEGWGAKLKLAATQTHIENVD
jgi:hypothetical protein